jgi:precorrin-2 dehydrogenase/sirohydrochlorin ferrochelatase
MFPLFLDLTNRLCLVVGAGPVGQRKAAALLESGALVRQICLEPRPPEQTSSRLDWRTAPYHSQHLDGVVLAFTAATSAVNAAVVADARHRGIWVNSATDPGGGDFFVPATLRRGDFILAVSTGGAAPGLAQSVRQRLETEFDEAIGVWVALLAELRPVVLAGVADPDQRRDLFARWCDWSWLERLRREGPEAVRMALLANVEALAAASNHPL